MGLIGSIVIGFFALLGTPLFIVILAAAMLGFYLADIPLMVIAIEIYRLIDTPLLLALPLFTFAGYLLAESQLSSRLVRLTQVFLGWMPGGLAVVSFVTCAFFTAFTGASGVTIVAVGALLFPALVEAGYKEKFSLGLVTTSGSLGLLLAPSLPLILYGVIVQQMDIPNPFTIQELFLAGILPALLMIVLLTFYSLWSNRDVEIVKGEFSRADAISAIKDARWEIPMPFIVLGGIYSGFFAVSEAAAVTAFYVLVVEVFIHREVSIRALPGVIRDAMTMVGGILLILGVSLAFTNYLIDAEIPQLLFDWISTYVSDKITFLILLNIVLLILGALLDIFSALVIMIPLIVPVALRFGIDPVHLGIIFLANMQIGYFTPPIGMNLFIASYRFDRPITELYRATIPFMFVLLFALIVITYIPEVSLAFLDR
ncbi:MAG: TRAP transporter large permease subunit [Pseudomonadales bacterium]|jgi:tripartite ATP-independent transporter DctM subunit|nr:TRAP transporter large permease subunit [Pseudomonadales bacterium]MDC3358704.1 TRAP transporter large permease subunit [Pseudomonadales bacterium]MDG1002258.1 TRAP transporter large permease subunit [Pseudomonadales bacterium]MDG1305456.1 TRAP transporter large permease subunit [Pseudomonadales bacterium]MDG1907793.1 TRAP transporter large permease subunit [Pseudomonadales bacterium]|tara:strand:+ start:3442 stop:4725 length:1284 start_codon:yes stop_codon:yes gene_type:complete